MIRQIVRDVDFLSQKSVPATRADMPIIRDLIDTLYANREHCVGMAANMIGELKTILIARLSGEAVIMVNPVITDRSAQSYEVQEGCLSLLGTRPTTRSKVITVEYLDRKFKKRRMILRDLEAQIVQHEMDHFEGKII